MLKRFASKLPASIQQNLKRIYQGRQIKKGRFTGDEPEFFRLAEWLKEGDWCIDVGANIGHYTKGMSDLVGLNGRVIAIEPIANTFDLLASNVTRFPFQNVSLINAAASDEMGVASMGLPCFDSGLTNYYRAAIGNGNFKVLTFPVDTLPVPKPIALIKIDVEGHEFKAIAGMEKLIRRDKPVLIVEGADPAVERVLIDIGYHFTESQGSPNRVYVS